MIRYLVIIFFVFLFGKGYAQQNYSDSELTSFAEVYFLEKEIPGIDEEKIRDIFNKHAISKEFYLNLKKDKNHLNGNELSAFEKELNNYENLVVSKRNFELKKLCQKRGLPLDTYLKIRQQFRTSITFQRSLYPFIQEYFKSEAGD